MGSGAAGAARWRRGAGNTRSAELRAQCLGPKGSGIRALTEKSRCNDCDLFVRPASGVAPCLVSEC
jgi:hypothetical protein